MRAEGPQLFFARNDPLGVHSRIGYLLDVPNASAHAHPQVFPGVPDNEFYG